MDLELEEIELKLKRNEILKRRQELLLENSGPIQRQQVQIHPMSSQINAASLPWSLETFGTADCQDASTTVGWMDIEDVRVLPTFSACQLANTRRLSRVQLSLLLTPQQLGLNAVFPC